tara:strand:+ start:3844 stop:4302 length:459 start_codon:yes stop_codon:yes gene_type:complete
MKTVEELITELDPNRDYGERSYTDVVDGVRNGYIAISPGMPTPILRDIGRGVTIKGTGRPVVTHEHRSSNLARFEERGEVEFDSAFEAFMQNVMNGDVKAQMYFFDRMLGKPRESRESAARDEMNAFWASFAGTTMAQVKNEQPKVIDVELD